MPAAESRAAAMSPNAANRSHRAALVEGVSLLTCAQPLLNPPDVAEFIPKLLESVL
jgi:hypothetical protein